MYEVCCREVYCLRMASDSKDEGSALTIDYPLRIFLTALICYCLWRNIPNVVELWGPCETQVWTLLYEPYFCRKKSNTMLKVWGKCFFDSLLATFLGPKYEWANSDRFNCLLHGQLLVRSGTRSNVQFALWVAIGIVKYCQVVCDSKI